MKKPTIIVCLWIFVLCWNVYPASSGCAKHLEDHVKFLSSIRPFRNFENPESLNKAADYIFEQFKTATSRVVRQKYRVEREGFKNHEYQNIIASFGPETGERIILGAHYDACGDTPAADDNATGVAAIIELARMLKNKRPKLKYRVDLIAYSLEEPPFFRSKFMGSAIHADFMAKQKIDIRLMISVDMIGYFNPKGKSGEFFPRHVDSTAIEPGNTTAVVGKKEKAAVANSLAKLMMKHSTLKVLPLNLPGNSPGIDYSDHLNYWNHGYPAVMISNFPACHNPAYHQPEDTIEKLNFAKIAEIVKGLYAVVTVN